MTASELETNEWDFYFDPYDIVEKVNCNKNVFVYFLNQNYLDHYYSIEEVA